MFVIELSYYNTSGDPHPAERFDLKHLNGSALDFAESYNLQEEFYAGEYEYQRETNVEEVRKWIADGIVGFFSTKAADRYDRIVLSNPSTSLVIRVFDFEGWFLPDSQ